MTSTTLDQAHALAASAARDETSIDYDRATGHYAVFDGLIPIAFGRSYHEAELKRLAYLTDLDAEGLRYTAAELDPPFNDPAPSDGPGDPIPGDDDYEYPRALCDICHTLVPASAFTFSHTLRVCNTCVDASLSSCDFCGAPAHRGSCAELLAFVERVRATLYAPACPSCGDPTRGSERCAACLEDAIIDLPQAALVA